MLANEKTYLNDRYAKKEVKEQVIRADQLIATIRRMNAESKLPKSTKKEMLGFGEKMLERDTGEGRLYVRYAVENLCFERHAAEQIQENNFMAVPVFQSADTY